jgi:hypothetical protein
VLASLGPVMLALSVQTGAELDDLAFLFTSRAVGYLLGSIISGYLVDKVPGHRLMFAGLLANSVATGLFPLMKSIPPLAGLSSVQGLTMGFLDTGIEVAAVATANCDNNTADCFQQRTSYCCGCMEIRVALGCKQCTVFSAWVRWCHLSLFGHRRAQHHHFTLRFGLLLSFCSCQHCLFFSFPAPSPLRTPWSTRVWALVS